MFQRTPGKIGIKPTVSGSAFDCHNIFDMFIGHVIVH